ncbi:MAG: hypothetical protein WBW04_21950 [Nitrolancea sp.]
MSAGEKRDQAEARRGPVALIEIPSDKASQVLDFIANLDATDDVSGHMLRLGVAATRTELTNCHHTGEDNSDWSCADVTTW